MAVYELINPSDAYTLRADDDRIAIAACGLLGGGWYGLEKRDDPEFRAPIGDIDGYHEALGGDFGEFVAEHSEAVAACLESVLIGDYGDRETIEDAQSRMPESERRSFLDAYHERRRSSLNDIGRKARACAAQLRGAARADAREEAGHAG